MFLKKQTSALHQDPTVRINGSEALQSSGMIPKCIKFRGYRGDAGNTHIKMIGILQMPELTHCQYLRIGGKEVQAYRFVASNMTQGTNALTRISSYASKYLPHSRCYIWGLIVRCI